MLPFWRQTRARVFIEIFNKESVSVTPQRMIVNRAYRARSGLARLLTRLIVSAKWQLELA